MPHIYKELDDTVKRMEAHFGDMQDVEFTVQHGVLYILQTRDGKRGGAAALKVRPMQAGIMSSETAQCAYVPCAYL